MSGEISRRRSTSTPESDNKHELSSLSIVYLFPAFLFVRQLLFLFVVYVLFSTLYHPLSIGLSTYALGRHTSLL